MSYNRAQEPTRRVVVAGLTAALAAAAGAGATRAGAVAPAGAGRAAGAAAPACGPSAESAAPRKAPAGRWDAFNLSPRSRTVRPVAVHTTTGAVRQPEALVHRGRGAQLVTRITGAGSSVTYDFGKEVGGFVTAEHRAQL